jgi:outer membrane lipoprotein-sorting protein
MRFVFALAAFSLVASCKLHQLASVASFEGEIDMSTSTSLGASTAVAMKFKLKGTKMRTETAGLGYATITDADAKKSWTLNPSARTYTEIALPSKTSAAPKSKVKAVKTARTDTVAGRACDVYEMVDPSSPTPSPIEMCMASGLGMIALGLSGPFASFAQGEDDAWSEAFSHGFPLRITLRDPSGKPIVNMEATRIERKSVPDSEFQVPAGYTKTASPI